MGRKGNGEGQLKLVETRDAFVLYCREADLDVALDGDCIDLFKLDFYPLFGDLGDLLEGGVLVAQVARARRFKYLLVPKRRAHPLQKLLLSSFIGGVPHLLPTDGLGRALADLGARTIFNGLPLRCLSVSTENSLEDSLEDSLVDSLLAIALPSALSELVWRSGLDGRALPPQPKVLFPALNLYHAGKTADLLKGIGPGRGVSFCFGGLSEHYARFSGGASAPSHRRLQAAFLELIERACTAQLFCDLCRVEVDWRWARADAPFSGDLRALIPTMEKFPALKREEGAGVCRCSPQLLALARRLRGEGIERAVFFGYFFGVPKLDLMRATAYAVLFDAPTAEARLLLWWPHFNRIGIKLFSALELERLAELEVQLLGAQTPMTEDQLDACLTDLFALLGTASSAATRFYYLCSPPVAEDPSSEAVEDDWLKSYLPRFCRRCGLFVPIFVEPLRQTLQRRETPRIEATTEWIN